MTTGMTRLGSITIQYCPHLTKLIFNFNRLKSLSDSLFSSLQKLRTFQVKGNVISHLLRQLLKNLLSLRAVDLSQNILTGVDGELLSGLSQLDIPTIVYTIVFFVCVCGLQPDQCPLARHFPLLPEKLDGLNLCSNLISNFSSETFPSRFEELDLKGNRLVQLLPDSFGRLTSLPHLFLSMNQLIDLPEDFFGNLTALQNLDLSENQLTSLPRTIFQDLTKIKIVHLQNNNLSFLEAKLFEDQAFLEKLYLSENDLQTLPQGFFDAFFHENVMRIRRNDWSCDCHMLYLYDYVAGQGQLVEDISNVYCTALGL
ncbi:unnamed protein product [Coregonus sp. 'balchen']|nr:unnamed protein product [Coregonus sp. 'balchen']